MTVGELVPELVEESGSYYEEFRKGLIPEFQEKMDRLTQTEKGSEVLNDEDFREYVTQSSEFLDDQYQKITSGVVELGDYTNEGIGNLYDSISSLIDTKRLYPVLDFVRQGTEREIEELIKGNPDGTITELLRKRRLASIVEELSRVYPDKEQAARFEKQARELNREVGDSDLDLATSPRKFHAMFSVYDIDFRRLSQRARQSMDLLEPFVIEFNDMQTVFYLEMWETVAEVRAIDADKEALSGSIGDTVLLGRFRERFMEDDRFPNTEASQGYIRQDNTDLAKFIPVNPEKPFKWIMAFDLLVEDIKAPRDMFVEAKNLINGSSVTGKPGSYLPIIEVITMRFGSSKADSFEMIERYCRAKEKVFAGEHLFDEEQEIVETIHSILDQRIDNVMQRLDHPLETSTNYVYEKGRSPFIHEVAEETASDT